jgi:ABC-type uncharacterized transport system ATPase subunit
VIESKNLSKSFGSFTALSELSLKFESQKIHAVLGENGAGKSTLMKLLFGLYQPSSGEILINSQKVIFENTMDAIKAGIGMVQQHFCLVENMTALDNIILGAEPVKGISLDRNGALKDLESKLLDQSLHVPWHRNVSELSIGYRQRIEILKLMYRDSQFLILDEPTAVLTPQEIASFFSLLRRLKELGRTIVLITHKLQEVFEVCDQFHVLRAGKHIASGEVSQTTPAELVKYMIGRELVSLEKTRESLPGQTLLKFSKVSTEVSQRGALKNIYLQIQAGEICGVAGVEGSGQSKLIEALMGLCSFTGEIEFLGQTLSEQSSTDAVRKAGLALIPEDRHSQAIWLEESCAKNLVIGIEDKFEKNNFFDEAKIRFEVKPWLEQFDVRLHSVEQEISSLSGGNQQKIVFAREVLGRQPRFIICHQPTRGVDLGAIEKIHGEILRLRNKGVSCLLISSELEELMSLSDRMIVMFDGQISGEFKRNEFSKNDIGRAMTGMPS